MYVDERWQLVLLRLEVASVRATDYSLRHRLTEYLGGIIFPIFFHRVMLEVGFNGALRYTALMIGILMAASCFLITARLPRRNWDWDTKWFDVTLFKEKQFALFTIGAFFAM